MPAMRRFRYIYGPVDSWRLGRSLGVDILPQKEKICTFDCTYCQVGRKKPVGVDSNIKSPVGDIVNELKSLPRLKIDYITFSGTGEPTLSKDLAAIIREVRKIRREKIAVFTNSSLLFKRNIQDALMLADLVEVKLDAFSPASLRCINHPSAGLRYRDILSGIKEFRSRYRGKFCLQIMFTQDNIKHAKSIADIARSLNPDKVELNTPLRPSDIKPVSRRAIQKAAGYFKGLDTASVYDRNKKSVIRPLDDRATKYRRGDI
jgi:wyosine [tRNA(Phe)-imidazoG37] synthetase (radical SAM superfamily)